MVGVYAIVLGVFSWQVGQGHLALLDGHVAQVVSGLRSPGLDGAAHLMTCFGSSVWSGLALAGLSGWAWRRGRKREVRLMVAAFALGLAVTVALRLLIPHWRPDVLVVPSPMGWATRLDLSGFPSGHAYRSAFLFGWLSQELGAKRGGRWGQVACLGIIGMVGFTRVALNRHWASDVVGGWLLASCMLVIALAWKPRLSPKAA